MTECHVTARFLPRHCCLAGSYDARVFCGTYSPSGDVFISAGQSEFGGVVLSNRGNRQVTKLTCMTLWGASSTASSQ